MKRPLILVRVHCDISFILGILPRAPTEEGVRPVFSKKWILSAMAKLVVAMCHFLLN